MASFVRVARARRARSSREDDRLNQYSYCLLGLAVSNAGFAVFLAGHRAYAIGYCALALSLISILLCLVENLPALK